MLKAQNIFPLLSIILLSLLVVACGGTLDSGTISGFPKPGFADPSPTPAPTLTSSPVATGSEATPTLPEATKTPNPEATATLTLSPIVAASPTAAVTLPPTATKPPIAAATTKAAPTVPARTVTPVKATPTAKPTNPYSGPLSEVVRGTTGRKMVAITLDAGAGADPFPKMLKALDNAGVKITFFLTGAWAQQNSNYVQQIVNSGQEIANHTWSHPDLIGLNEEQIRSEIERTDAFLSKFTGHSTRPLWRAPFGSRDARVMKIVNSMGYRSIFWTIDSLDSVGQPKTAKFLIDRITGQSDAQLDGEIILMHIGNATSAEALPTIIQNLQQRGFKIVTVSQLLG